MSRTCKRRVVSRRGREGARTGTYLENEVPAAEVRDRPGQPRPPPSEAQEEGALLIREFLHHLPEPLDEGGACVDPLVAGDGLEEGERNVLGTANHRLELVAAEEGQQRDWNDFGHTFANRGHLPVELVQPGRRSRR